MNNPGDYLLGAVPIGAAKTLTMQSPIVNLDGMSAVTLEATFAYAGGGATCTAIVATSFDGGTTWRQVARFDFGTAARVAYATISGLVTKAVTTYADLNAEGINDTLLGDRLALFEASSGTYTTGTLLSVRAAVR